MSWYEQHPGSPPPRTPKAGGGYVDPPGFHWQPIGGGYVLLPGPSGPVAPAPAPPSSPLPPAPSPSDPKEFAAALYDKAIPAALAGRVEMGGRVIEGPVFGVSPEGEAIASFIVGYYIPINYWSDTRTVTKLWFRGKEAWNTTAGVLLSGLNVGGATSGTEQRVRFATGTLTQAADDWSTAKFGDSAVAYIPLVTGTFENIRVHQFGDIIPFTSVTVEDTCFGDPDDGVAWSDALAAIARYDGRATSEFEAVDVTGSVSAIIMGSQLYFPDFLTGMRKLKPNWNIRTADKLYVVEKGVFSQDLEVDIAKVIRQDDHPIVIHRTDAFDKPREKLLSFLDIDRDYEPNTVRAAEDLEPVPSTDAFDSDAFNIPVASTSSQMISELNFAYYTEEIARENSEFSAQAHYLGLDPGDTLKIPTDERDYYHRITEIVRKVDFTVDVKAEGFLTCAIAESTSTINIVAVGQSNGSSAPIVMGSNAGTSWEAETPNPSTDAGLFAVSSNGSLFVAVGGDGSGNPVISTSPDGTTWTQQTSAPSTNAQWEAVIWDGSQFVIGGDDFTSNHPVVALSADALSWTSHIVSTATSASVYDLAFGGGVYVAVGFDGSNPFIWSSTNATSWTSRTPSPSTNALAGPACHDGTQFIVGGQKSTGTLDPIIMTSPDGVTWSPQTPDPTTLAKVSGLASHGGLTVAVGSRDPTFATPIVPVIMTSSDGVTWTSRTPNPATNAVLNSITFTEGLWIAVGFDGDTQTDPIIMTSPDGIVWTQRTASPTSDAIIYDVKGSS